MQTGSYKPYTINRETLYGVTHQGTGVMYTNAIQGSVPAANGKFTLTDLQGNIIGGINAAAATYAGGNVYNYDIPAAVLTLTAHGGLSGYKIFQLVNNSGGAVLAERRERFTPPPIPTGLYTPNSPLTLGLRPSVDQAGTVLTDANTSGWFWIGNRETGVVYRNEVAATSFVSGVYYYTETNLANLVKGQILRVRGELWDLAGVTWISSEVYDLYPN